MTETVDTKSLWNLCPGYGSFPAFLQSCETCSRYRASDLLSPGLKCPAPYHSLNLPSARPARRLSEVKLNVHGRQARATRGTVFPRSLPDRNKREPAKARPLLQPVTRGDSGEPCRALRKLPRLKASCPTGANNSCNKFLGVPYRVPQTNISVKTRALREARSMAPPPDAQRLSAEPPASDANDQDSTIRVPSKLLSSRVGIFTHFRSPEEQIDTAGRAETHCRFSRRGCG